jgi:hypothetical protein
MCGSYKFKVANVHFETNSSACDMRIQIGFDTEGLTQGSIAGPNGKQVYAFKSSAGMKATGGQTEGFLEGIEPQIRELMNALGGAPSKEEGTSTLADLFTAWPQGNDIFSGLRNFCTKPMAACKTPPPQHKLSEATKRLAHRLVAGPRRCCASQFYVTQHRPTESQRCRLPSGGSSGALLLCDQTLEFPGAVRQHVILRLEQEGIEAAGAVERTQRIHADT